MRYYVFEQKQDAEKAEKFISDLAGCPFNDGVNAYSKKRVHNVKTEKPHKYPNQGTENWAMVRPRRDGKYFFLIPEGLKANGKFANIPLLDVTKHNYVIEEFHVDWNPIPPPPPEETPEEKQRAIDNKVKI